MKNKKEKNIIVDDFDISEYLDEDFNKVPEKKEKKNTKEKLTKPLIIEEVRKVTEEDLIKKYEEKEQKEKEEKLKDKKVTKKESIKEEKQDEQKEEIVFDDNYYDKKSKPKKEKKQKKVKEKKIKESKQKTVKENKKVQKEELYYEDRIKEKKPVNYHLIINLVFIVILFIISMITIDYIAINKYNSGPFFAINTKTYNDGGTKEYYGIGYKVIKYNQLVGRKDTIYGFWSIKYQVEPTEIEDIDLAIEFTNNESKTYEKYYNQYVRINSKLKSINKKNNTITIGYKDEDGKYTMNIVCKMATKNSGIENLKVDEDITIIGTVKKYTSKTTKAPMKLKVINCYVED